MRVKRLVLISAGALLVLALLAVCFAPLIVAQGLRIWAQRTASRAGLRLELGEIDAPFFRPVIVKDVRIRSEPGMPFRVEGAAPRIELGLNYAGVFAGSQHPLRSLVVDGLTITVRRDQNATAPARAAPWRSLQKLLAENFKLSAVNLHLENEMTTIDVHDAALTGSEMEAGLFSAREVSVAAPWFQKTFSNLRGASSWEQHRLLLGGLTPIRGLTIDTISIDLSQIGQTRLAMELNLDAFGGKIRGRVSSDDRGGKRTWDIAGNGAGVSLAEMSDALEWENRASGSLHASKFTFRGELNDLRNATATLWAEISGLTWRDRTADTVMIGASLYNRALQLEQLYIKQRNNQLTLSGEFGWPEKSAALTAPAFRGDLSASIHDLGEFARLFGWSPSEFAGQLLANGSVNVREGKLGGELTISGNSLTLFSSPIEALEMKLGLEGSRVRISQLELRQTGDFLHAEGNFALTSDHAYEGAFRTSIAELANYRGFFPKQTPSFKGSLAAEWKGHGANEAGSGTFQAQARNFHVADGPLVPFDVALQADYSPERVFFREFHFWNQRADFSAFLNATRDYFQLQDLEFKLNGRSRLQGNVFLPISVWRLRDNPSWLASLSADPFFDGDLVLDGLDLAELATAIKTKPDFSGQATGHLQLSGTPASLQGKTEFHLRDFVVDASPPLALELDARLVLGMLNLKGNAIARGSDPLKIEGSVPLQIEKQDAGYVVATKGPLSGSVNFPAIFLAKLPTFLSRGVFTRGILSGNLNLADSVQEPLVTGSVNLVDGQLLRGTTVSAGISFKGRNAIIDFAHLKERDADISARGEIDFANIADIRLTLLPNVSLTSTMALSADDCVNDVTFYASPSVARLSGSVNEIGLRGSLLGSAWTISLSNGTLVPQTFALCRDGKTLSLGLAPVLFP